MNKSTSHVFSDDLHNQINEKTVNNKTEVKTENSYWLPEWKRNTHNTTPHQQQQQPKTKNMSFILKTSGRSLLRTHALKGVWRWVIFTSKSKENKCSWKKKMKAILTE